MLDRFDRNEYTFRDTRLEEAVRSAIIQMDKMADDYLRDYLTARGIILATPERDAMVAALPLPGGGCSCTPHEQSAGGAYTEYLLEYEPACPEHSEHLWDPKQGAWVLRSEHDAEVAAKTLREAADVLNAEPSNEWADEADLEAVRIIGLLRDRADRIEREAGETDADA